MNPEDNLVKPNDQATEFPLENKPAPPVTRLSGAPTPAPSTPVSNNKKPNIFDKLHKRFSLPILVALALLVIGGVGAGAYFGLILPSRPENKLAAAFVDLAEQRQLTISGKVDYLDKQTDSSIPGFAMDYSIKVNSEKTLLDWSGKVGIQGVEIPYNVRFVDQDLYLKVSELDSLGTLLSATGSEEAAAYGSILKTVNDQWYVIDRSFLQQAGASATCIADLSFALNEDDIDKVKAAYDKYPLFTIKNASSEEVDGVATSKYELEPASDETAKKFADELNSLSVVEKIKACVKDVAGEAQDELEEATGEETEGSIYAYVTGDGRFKKIEFIGSDETSDAKLTMNFEYGDVTIEKPEGAKPIQDIINDLFGEAAANTEQEALDALNI